MNNARRAGAPPRSQIGGVSRLRRVTGRAASGLRRVYRVRRAHCRPISARSPPRVVINEARLSRPTEFEPVFVGFAASPLSVRMSRIARQSERCAIVSSRL